MQKSSNRSRSLMIPFITMRRAKRKRIPIVTLQPEEMNSRKSITNSNLNWIWNGVTYYLHNAYKSRSPINIIQWVWSWVLNHEHGEILMYYFPTNKSLCSLASWIWKTLTFQISLVWLFLVQTQVCIMDDGIKSTEYLQIS